MATFEEARQQLRQARTDLAAKEEAAFAAGERLWRIERQREELRRAFDPQNGAHVQRAVALDAAHAEASGAIAKARENRAAAVAAEAGLFGLFGELSDPRQIIGRLTDNVPILLLPVRLETRFKGTQLWVRVYPDEISVDTFEPLLSQSEMASAKEYWLGVFQGSPFEDQLRGAWRGLVASHGAGRAAWILDVRKYEPLNLADLQPKVKATDVVLTMPTEEPPNPLETAAIGAYWIALWRADGETQASQDAFDALAGALGGARAEEIANGPQPSNFAAVPVPPETKASVTATFSWVVFPPSETLDLKESSWARAARAVLLPDRFVFIGYRQGAAPRVELGLPVPSSLVVGPDPSAPEDERLRRDADGNLIIPDDMQWMVDFNRAVQVGMGFRLDLDAAETARGFDRVLVVGIRAGDDETGSAAALTTLIEHHRFSRTGFELVAQGTPTNNTESASTPFVRGADADASFDDRKTGDLFTHSDSWLAKADGQWLAEWLGLDETAFQRVHGAGGRDQSDARAMNTALWPATIDYWMESLMDPGFDDQEIGQTRDFFTTFVSGRGAVPAIRVGRQPYGILPATALSRMEWLRPRINPTTGAGGASYLDRLYQFLLRVDTQWRLLAEKVAYAGKEGVDPHQNLLDVVGLHSGAASWSYRWAESAQQYWNQIKLAGFAQIITALLQQAGAIQLLNDFGWTREPYPNLLEKFFFGKHDPLKGPVVDDVPLSETAPLREATDDHRNYIQWLIDASKTSLQALYAQDGFTKDQPPKALLYLLLRHALQLGYHDVAVRLHVEHDLLDLAGARSAKRDDPFIHVRAQAPQSESRYQLLYKTEPAITGSATQPIGQFIAASMPSLFVARLLFRQLQALELLKDASTARLERAFAEHIDCCTYRLDAWLLGLVHAQLTTMRRLVDAPTGPQAPPRRQGVHLGAYAWLEDLRPENKVLTPFKPDDPELAKIFAAGPPLVRDSTNFGYIHAPSLNHAVAAAVLRNGYMSNASPANRQTLAVNLSSERVRTAVALIEGIRAGQSLAALLGYQFERGLHDRNAAVNVDQYIYDIRLAFPLAGKKIKSTQPPEGTSIEKIEARNVIDGLALVNQIKATGTKTYPFGKAGLPNIADASALAVINDEADRLVESHDAVADLALAEGVYQAVIGNYDRVASTYDAYAKGEFPPEPQVVRTPSNGVGLTHRVALHLRPGLSPIASPLAGVPMTPRAQAEPAINRWLFDTLPPLGDVGCVVSFRDAANAPAERQVTLLDLAVQPADFLRLFRDEARQEMAELDDRIVRHLFATETPRPEAEISIRYMEKTTAPLSVFELLPLLRQLRRLATTSRPLRSSDSSRTNDAKQQQDATVLVDRARVAGVRAALAPLADDLQDFIDAVSPDPLVRVADFETYLTGAVELLARAAEFGIPQTGWGFAYDTKRRLFTAVFKKVADIAARWDGRLAKFDALLATYDPAADEAAKLDLLAQAALQITTAPLPQGGLADDIKTDLETTARTAFVTKRAGLATFLGTSVTAVPQLLLAANGLLPLTGFDAAEVSFAEEEQQAVLFADDAVGVVQVVLGDVRKRLAASLDRLDAHDAAADAAARVEALDAAAKALLGDDVFLVPEFTLTAVQADELANAAAASTSGALLAHLTAADPFPVDTWLYGVARVREKIRALEQVVVLAELFGGVPAPPRLTPLQLPFVAGEGWLALELPPGAALDRDRLLYTAAFSVTPFDKTAPQCGLLLDEWTEVIPTPEVETGIAFHYDRPSCEAPQSLLLVTPSDFRGEWQWTDLIDALNETLDLGKRRAVEPDQIDATAYAPFLPATVSAVTHQQISISAVLALNNNLNLPKGGP